MIKNILVVEDNATCSAMLRGQLQQMYPQAEVATASDAPTGLLRIDSELFDVLLLDLTLGDYEPMNTLEAYKPAMRVLPTVVVTGTVDDSVVTAAMQAGADCVIPKKELSFTVLRLSIENATMKQRQHDLDKRFVELARELADVYLNPEPIEER